MAVRVGLLLTAAALLCVSMLTANLMAKIQFEQRIVELVRSTGDGDTDTLGSVAGSDWSVGYVFLAYDSVDDINAQIGFDAFPAWDPFVAETSDGEQLLVFVRKHRVVGAVHLAPDEFVFSPDAFTAGDESVVIFNAASDAFVVRRNGGVTELHPTQVP
jgi:hypothetical protein